MEHLMGTARRTGSLGLVASCLAVVACYGTLAALGSLSLMGVTLTLHEGAWAGAITAFALLALSAIALGGWRRGRTAPGALALAGFALIVWVMFVQYAFLLELTGFALLVGAAIWDWKLGKSMKQEEQRNG